MTSKRIDYTCPTCRTLLIAASNREMKIKRDLHSLKHTGGGARPLASRSMADLAAMLPR